MRFSIPYNDNKKKQVEYLQKKMGGVVFTPSRNDPLLGIAPGNFYPDFILWLLDGDRQHIIFADPHGLQHARGFSDSKVLFSKRIKQIESERLQDKNVCLDAFILSPTSFNEIKYFDESLQEHRDPARSKARFQDHHILFMYDDAETYVNALFTAAL